MDDFENAIGNRHDGEAGNGLPSSRILSLLEDRAGRLWVGTQDGGVVRRDGDRFIDPLPEPLPSAVVWSLAEDREGAIWIGTEEGVVRFAEMNMPGEARDQARIAYYAAVAPRASEKEARALRLEQGPAPEPTVEVATIAHPAI